MDRPRWERIDGVIYDMSPSPSTEHQRIVGRLFVEIGGYLKGRTSQSFTAPFDVYLDGDESGNYVQPDITQSFATPRNYVPKDVLEFRTWWSKCCRLRRRTRTKKTKLKIYRAAGVREYWMVDPHLQLVEVCLWEDGNGFPTVYGKDDTVPVRIFADLSIRLQEIFA